jgi:hypothetical protein
MPSAALDWLVRAVQSALAWSMAPPGVFIVGGGGAALVVAGLVALRLLSGRGQDAGAAPAEEAVEARILVLKLKDDVGHQVGVRLTALLTRRCGQGTSVAHVGGSPIKPGGDLDDEARRAREFARTARVGLAIWGEVKGDVLHARLLHRGAEAMPEVFSVPASLRWPFDVAAAAYVTAVAAETAALSGLRGPLARAVEELAAVLESDPPSDEADAARVRAALARAALALDGLEPGQSHLDAALSASAPGDRRRGAEPLEWAESRSVRAQVLSRRHAGLPEAPLEELRERAEAHRAALDVWTNAGIVSRMARGEPEAAQALLDVADLDGDMRGAEHVERIAAASLSRRETAASSRAAAVMTSYLGAARLRLGEREPRPERLEAAERDLRRALVLAEEAGDKERIPVIKVELARALARLGERDRGSKRLRAAAVIYRVCLTSDELDELTRANVRAALGRTLVHVGERDRDAAAVDEAVGALRMASNAFTTRGGATAITQTQRALARAERLYAELRAARAGVKTEPDS